MRKHLQAQDRNKREVRPQSADHLKQALALPGVEEELHRLSKLLPGKVMLNESFGWKIFPGSCGIPPTELSISLPMVSSAKNRNKTSS